MYDTDIGTKEYSYSYWWRSPVFGTEANTIWKILYDKVLWFNLPDEAKLAVFSGGIITVVTVTYLEEIEELTNESIPKVKRWMEAAGLTLAKQKTEVLLVSSCTVKE